MNIIQKLWITLLHIAQALGFSAKTYNLLHPLPRNTLKRKGHLLHNPTEQQIEAIRHTIIKQSRLFPWTIIDTTQMYDYYNNCEKDGIKPWHKRHLSVIDTIVIAATNGGVGWDAASLFDLDTSKENNITPGKPLPGSSYHLFVNASDIVERISAFENITYHTPGVNTRSIGIVIQYKVDNNSAPPTSKIIKSLEKILTILCLEFKLDPYKAIKTQSSVRSNLIPWLKGHKDIKDSPGVLVDINSIQKNVAVTMQKKLRYACLYNGPINGKINKATRKAINEFYSDAVQLLYNNMAVNYYK